MKTLRFVSVTLCCSFAVTACSNNKDAKKTTAKKVNSKNKRDKPSKAKNKEDHVLVPDKLDPAVATRTIKLQPGKDQYGDSLPEGVKVRMGTARFRHLGAVSAIAVSPDGHQIVACAFSSDTVWDIDTGKRVRKVDCGAGVFFSLDGSKLITTKHEHLVELDYATLAPSRKLTFHTKNIRYLAASKDRTKVLTVAADKTAKLVDLKLGKELRKFKVPGMLRGAALSPDARFVAINTDGIKLYDTRTGKPLALELGDTRYTSVFEFSPDSKRFVVAHHHMLRVWDLKSGKQATQIDMQHSITAIAYSRDGALLAVANGHDIALLDAATNATKRVVKRPSSSGGVLLFTPDNKRLVCGASKDNRLRVVDVATGVEQDQRPAHWNTVTSIMFAKGDTQVLSVGNDGTVRAWDASNGVQLAKWQPKLVPDVSSSERVAAAKDGHYLALATGRRMVQLWDTVLGKPHKTLTIDVKSTWAHPSAVAITPDAKVVAALTSENAIVWDADKGTQRKAWKTPAHTDLLALSPDGKWLATIVHKYKDPTSKDITIWNSATGARARTLHGHTKSVKKMAFLADGRLVSLGDDDTVRLWNVATGKELRKMSRRNPRDLAVSADGKRLAIADGWGTVEIWDLAGPALIHTIKLHIWFRSIALSSNGKMLASADATNDVVLRPIPK